MAKGEDITTRFKVDISDLKKGITEANNQIKLANSEFKKASAGMDDWAKSSEGIKSKLTQLKSVLEAQNLKLQSYQKQLETAKRYEQEAATNVTKLKQALEQAKTAYGSNSSEVKKLQTQLTAAEKAEMQMKNQVASLTVTMNNQEGAVNGTKREMSNLESSLKQVEKAEKNAALHGTTVEQELKKMDDAARKAKDGFTVFKGALSNLVADGIRMAVSGIKSLVSEAINASDALFKFEQTMNFAGYDNAAILKAKTEMKQYADETVYDLNTISNTTAQLAANGIQDYTGLTKAAGNLNAVAGGNADTFKSVALVLTQTAGAGKLTTENWNQLANAIPGASGKLQEALLQAGAYTGNFREAMEKGEITAEEFNAAIMTLGNEPVAVEAAKSVQTFEGAVGNMQAAVVDGLMKIIDAIGMENITGFINGVTSGIQTLIPIVQNIVNFFVTNGPVIVGILGSIAAGTAAYLAYTTAITVMKKGWMALEVVQKAVTAAQWLMNAAMTANPIGLVIAAVAALVAGFVILWNKSEAFRNFWIGLWENIKSATSTAWESIKNVWGVVSEWFNTTVIEPIKNFFSAMWTAITGFFTTAWNRIVAIWTAVATWFNNNVVEPIKTFFAPLVEWFTALFQSIWDFIESVFAVIAELAKGCVEAIKLIWGIVAEWFNTTVIKPLQDFFTKMWNNIKTSASNGWNNVKNVWKVASGWFNDTIIKPVGNYFNSMWNNLKTGASNAWTGVKNAFSPVVNWFKDQFTKAWTAVKNVFSTGGKIFDGIKEGIAATFKTVVNGIINGINKVIAVPFNTINKALDKIRNISIAGATPFSGLPTISIPQIPTLAKGGVLKKGQLGLLEGDGSEAVVPLEKNKFWIGKVADEMMKQLESGASNSINSLTNNNTNNFTQIINAPKQPSRIELYRQTRNLLELKGV